MVLIFLLSNLCVLLNAASLFHLLLVIVFGGTLISLNGRLQSLQIIKTLLKLSEFQNEGGSNMSEF